MLNSLQYNILACTAIQTRPPSSRKSYHLCHYNKSISCLPKGHTDKAHKIFANITSAEIKGGFNNHRWDKIGAELQTFYQGKYPCEIDQKA